MPDRLASANLVDRQDRGNAVHAGPQRTGQTSPYLNVDQRVAGTQFYDEAWKPDDGVRATVLGDELTLTATCP